MLPNFIHLEKPHADPFTCDAANFLDRGLHSFERKMLEQIVHETEIEGFVGRGDFKDVADLEMSLRKQGSGVLHILGAKIKAGVIQPPRYAVRIQKPKVIRGTAGGFEQRNLPELPTFGLPIRSWRFD